MIQRISVAAVLACVLAACSPPAQQAEDINSAPAAVAGAMQPGQYRTTVTFLETSVAGVQSSNINLPPNVSEHCVTSSDIADYTSGNATMPDNMSCTQNSMSTANGRIEGEATCTTPAGPMTTHMSGTYSSNRVEMEMTSTGTINGGQITQRMRMVNERIGECPAGETTD